jgi:predicted transposase YbfD/YdcC
VQRHRRPGPSNPRYERRRPPHQDLLHPKKVGALPVDGDAEAVKQTNEIATAIPLLDAIDIKDKEITADALLTQRKLAAYLIERGADYYFTVKANQPTLEQDIALHFQDRKQPDFVEFTPPDHGRIETRSIWTTTELNAYLNFPHVAQAFVIERKTVKKTTGKRSHEIAYGITSRSPQEADPKHILQINRGHWTIENTCHYVLDWNYDEDRCRIRTGHGPENVTRLRRFAISLIKARGVTNVAQKIRELNWNPKLLFDYLRMTENSCRTKPT